MKMRLLIMISIVAVMVISGCDDWENDVMVNGIKFTRFSHSSMKGYLAEDTLIQDYPCKKALSFSTTMEI